MQVPNPEPHSLTSMKNAPSQTLVLDIHCRCLPVPPLPQLCIGCILKPIQSDCQLVSEPAEVKIPVEPATGT